MAYLIVAYVIFVTLPLGLALSIWIRRTRIEQAINEIENRAEKVESYRSPRAV